MEPAVDGAWEVLGDRGDHFFNCPLPFFVLMSFRRFVTVAEIDSRLLFDEAVALKCITHSSMDSILNSCNVPR
ncbi:hypothetical protein FCULG_00002608 [Fusarium culmorum]|uniref:Uncharacterized protein n=1 Tax=Fusarium culmorum TaxID=5516 RepID=A0A2T4GML9_FUSCU|nr:hypothetical protein FCULG_00002608 [Fusarium culmorum]